MKTTLNTSILRVLAFTALASLGTTACGGSKAAGHTYAGADGVVRIEFQSDGKAHLSVGALSTPCTYKEAGKTLTLTCEDETTEFTIGDDGALNGPPAGMFARLAQEK